LGWTWGTGTDAWLEWRARRAANGSAVSEWHSADQRWQCRFRLIQPFASRFVSAYLCGISDAVNDTQRLRRLAKLGQHERLQCCNNRSALGLKFDVPGELGCLLVVSTINGFVDWLQELLAHCRWDELGHREAGGLCGRGCELIDMVWRLVESLLLTENGKSAGSPWYLLPQGYQRAHVGLVPRPAPLTPLYVCFVTLIDGPE